VKTAAVTARRLKIPAIILVVCLALLAGAPFLIKHLVKQWLLENGGEQVSVQDVDFNPFTATLVLEDLAVRVNDETTLSFESAGLDIAWRPLMDKRIGVQAVTLSGFSIILDNPAEQRMKVGGLLLPGGEQEQAPPQQPASSWTAGVDSLTLDNVQVRIRDPRLDAEIVLDNLELEKFAQWSPDKPARLVFSGSFNGAPVSLDGVIAPLAPQPHYRADVVIDGLPLESFSGFAVEQLRTLAGRLSYTGNIALHQGDTLSVTEKGSLTLDALELDLIRPDLDIRHDKLVTKGQLDLSLAGETLSLALAADISISGLGVDASNRKINLVRAANLDITDLSIDELDNIAIGEVVAQQLLLAAPLDAENATTTETALSRTGTLRLMKLAFHDNRLSADSFRFEDHHNHIVREADGSLRMVRLIDLIENLNEPATSEPDGDAGPPDTASGTQPAAGDASAAGVAEQDADTAAATADTAAGNRASTADDREPDTPPGAIDIVLGSTSVSSGSTVSFVDHSVEPAFETTLEVEELSLSQIDSRKPEQASPLTLKGTFDKHTDVAVTGSVKPFTRPVEMDLKSSIIAMDLPPLTPYTRDSLGVLLNSGTLDTKLRLAVQEQKLDGKAELTLHQLDIEGTGKKGGLQSKLPVPLNVALDTLRDKNDTIELEIPVEGDAGDPQFDVSDAINQAVAKGLKTGAASYLKLALQPYGTLITVAQYAGEQISKVRLNPVTFVPGQSTLDDRAHDYLGKVAQVLTDRPQLAIKLCGVTVPADRAWLEQQAQAKQAAEKPQQSDKKASPAPVQIGEQTLLTLAGQRAAAVKDELIAKHKVSASRLVGCRARIATDKSDAEPRTDLLI
jgi:hypothetical protein